MVMKVHDAIARGLTDLGVDHLFGVMGDANLYMIDSYVRHHKGTYVRATHEANAVLMALGYARMTDEVGIATITHGPALTNSLTALVEGVRTSVPIILLVGDTPVIDRQHNQRLDQRRFIEATGAGFELLRSPETVIDDLERAYRRARYELRPIAFNMPIDFQWEEIEYRAPRKYIPEARGVIPSSEDMDHAIGMIASAHAPIVLGGRGIKYSKNPSAVQAFAARLGAPTATTLRGKGLFADDDFNIGVYGTISNEVALEVIGKSDCLISFGASLNKYTAGFGGLTRGKNIIQVNQNLEHIGRYTRADIGLVGDPGLTAAEMVKWLDVAEIPDACGRTPELALEIKRPRAVQRKPQVKQKAGTVDLFAALEKIDRTVSQERTLVTDTGRFLAAAWPLMNVSGVGDYMDTIGWSSIGLGLGAAIGCASARPDRTTVFVAGDGGLAMGGLAELGTVMRRALNMIIVVCNDQAYGAEYVQFKAREMPADLSVNDWLDFTALAQSLGLRALKIDGPEKLSKGLELIELQKDDKRPLLLEIMTDPETMPPRT